MLDFEQKSLDLPGKGLRYDCFDDHLNPVVGGNRTVGPCLYPHMYSEHSRAQTFQKWVADWAVRLASFGFYFSRADECMRCAFCGLEVQGFPSPQEASALHRMAAQQDCPFLAGDVASITQCAEGTSPREHPTAGCENDLPFQDLEQCPSASLELPTCRKTLSRTSFSSPKACHTPVMSSARQVLLTTSPSQQSQSYVNQKQWSQHRPLCVEKAASCDQNQQPHEMREKLPLHNAADPAPTTPTMAVWTDIVLTARYPQMASYQKRLDTLNRWPLLRPTPKELARAGLFHTKNLSPHIRPSSHNPARSGREHWNHWYTHKRAAAVHSDSVVCFWCGERIHQWQKSDDALLEHARLSPGCRYVTQLLGQQLHNDIIKAESAISVENGEQLVAG